MLTVCLCTSLRRESRAQFRFSKQKLPLQTKVRSISSPFRLLASSFHMHDDSIHPSIHPSQPRAHCLLLALCVRMGRKNNSASRTHPLAIECESKQTEHSIARNLNSHLSPILPFSLHFPILLNHLPACFSPPKLPSNHVLTHTVSLVLPLNIVYHLMHIVPIHQSHQRRERATTPRYLAADHPYASYRAVTYTSAISHHPSSIIHSSIVNHQSSINHRSSSTQPCRLPSLL
jgi:hypothetical protein